MRVGIIGGSGLGEVLQRGMNPEGVVEHQPDTPFGPTSSPVVVGSFAGVDVALLQRHGPGHTLNPRQVPYRANIYALKELGVTHIVASGATGSLREVIEPGDIVLCDQLIDRTDGRPRTFYDAAAVHIEFADPFCPVMRRWLKDAAQHLDDVTVHDRGTYVCMEGPAFSTRAESQLHRQWGGDLIGMTALPEARLAREAEIAYALVALPTDYDSWRPRKEDPRPRKEDPRPRKEEMQVATGGSGLSGGESESLLEEIMGNLKRAVEASIVLMKAALSDVSILRDNPSPAHDALKLAIWSDKTMIDPAEVERLEVLWGRHFE